MPRSGRGLEASWGLLPDAPEPFVGTTKRPGNVRAVAARYGGSRLPVNSARFRNSPHRYGGWSSSGCMAG